MLKNKKIKIVLIISLITIVGIIIIPHTFAMQHYQTVDTPTGIVTASTLNVRSGPATTYKVITQVYKNEYVRIFAKVGSWYVIQTDKDYVGAVSSNYIRLIYPQSTNNSNNTTNNNSNLTADEQEVFNLINNKRVAAGLAPLEVNIELQNVARIKAKDMVDNAYFSHTSPTYGTPFEMIKNFGITYKAAGENIAGNSSNSGAVEAWMSSEGHRANILSNSFNYTGIGVVNSPTYGKIYVQMFIGK